MCRVRGRRRLSRYRAVCSTLVNPCSVIFLLFAVGVPRLMSATVSCWAWSACSRARSGSRALQGPQPGSVTATRTGFPRPRSSSGATAAPSVPAARNAGSRFANGQPVGKIYGHGIPPGFAAQQYPSQELELVR
jgi:hypothetical protein